MSVAEISRYIGISRQTLWRWRREGKVPIGNCCRDRKVLFTDSEADEIRSSADRVEPIGQSDDHQPSLFKQEGKTWAAIPSETTGYKICLGCP